jgi:hypothetical protein
MDKIKKDIATPLSDDDIRGYLPNAMIIKYSELSRYPALHDVLPEVKSFCFILYEDSMNKGHWTVISRPEEGVAEYFDSYGGYVDDPLRWTDKTKRVGLGEGTPMLSELFRKTEDDVIYNKIHYQKEGSGINDCGRWCVMRTATMLEGLNLEQFFELVKTKSKKMGLTFDQFVSCMVC